jgi:hypothetical protein
VQLLKGGQFLLYTQYQTDVTPLAGIKVLLIPRNLKTEELQSRIVRVKPQLLQNKIYTTKNLKPFRFWQRGGGNRSQ